MSPRKKSVAKEAADAAAVAYAVATVEARPEPAPVVEPVVWEDIPAPPVAQRLVVVESAPPCALDSAPIGAKCVVSRTEEGKAVRLLDSTGVVTLDKADVFYTLPAGAKVRKVAPDAFEVYRLGVQEAPLFVVHSAREAVRRFLEVVV